MLSIKPVVIMGTTGTGKMKISIDVSKRIRGEGVNADKMQIYVGLHITTNKVRLMINVVFLTTSLGSFKQSMMIFLYHFSIYCNHNCRVYCKAW
jgi:hypothetical protein